MTDDPSKCALCGYPRRVCQCVPSPPVKPVSGWQCPVCKRVHAPFVQGCKFCEPKTAPRPPREHTTLRHGMTIPLPEPEKE